MQRMPSPAAPVARRTRSVLVSIGVLGALLGTAAAADAVGARDAGPAPRPEGRQPPTLRTIQRVAVRVSLGSPTDRAAGIDAAKVREVVAAELARAGIPVVAAAKGVPVVEVFVAAAPYGAPEPSYYRVGVELTLLADAAAREPARLWSAPAAVSDGLAGTRGLPAAAERLTATQAEALRLALRPPAAAPRG